MEAAEDVVDESEWLKRSMFEYLFSERLKALEERDGIQRSVTLDPAGSTDREDWAGATTLANTDSTERASSR